LVLEGCGLWLGCWLTPLPGPPLLLLGEPLEGPAEGLLVLLAGVVVLVPGVVVFVGDVGPGPPAVVPEAAKATAGATDTITGMLQPALSSVRLETRNERSERSLPSDRPC
jgi:hypothetical protein